MVFIPQWIIYWYILYRIFNLRWNIKGRVLSESLMLLRIMIWHIFLSHIKLSDKKPPSQSQLCKHIKSSQNGLKKKLTIKQLKHQKSMLISKLQKYFFSNIFLHFSWNLSTIKFSKNSPLWIMIGMIHYYKLYVCHFTSKFEPKMCYYCKKFGSRVALASLDFARLKM